MGPLDNLPDLRGQASLANTWGFQSVKCQKKNKQNPSLPSEFNIPIDLP